jgi:hypothetical protein
MKTIQFFLGLTGVEEVSTDTEANLSCTCDGFKQRKKCKHVTWCESGLERGVFPIQVDKATPDSAIKKAKESDDEFRNLLMKYGKIEVI